MSPEELPEERMKKCSLLYDEGKTERSLGCFEDVLKFKPDSGFSHYLKGMCLYKLGRYTEAITCFDKSSGLEKDKHLPHYAKGVCLMHMEEYDKAVKSFKHAVELNQKDVDSMFMIAACFLLKNEEKKAREWMDVAMRMDALKAKALLQHFFEVFVLGDESLQADEKEALRKALDKI